MNAVTNPEWKWELEADEVMEIRNSEGVKVNVTAPATVYADVSNRTGGSVGMNFGQALEAAKQGKSVTRKGWNGKGQFVFLVKGTDLQNSLKFGYGEYLGEPTVVSALAIKTTSNHIQIGWLASQTDMLAEDWEVVE